MNEGDWLARRFEADRAHLRAVAVRLLGSPSEADDALQETWLRLSRADTSEVANLGGWLTTVVARVCLDMLRARRELPVDELPEPAGQGAQAGPDDPESQALMADSVGLAMLVVLEQLGPAERLAFVLHDLFAVPFDEIAPIVGRSPAAARQLASRARRRVQGAGPAAGTDQAGKRAVVEAFLAAAREGDFAGLLALLDPGVVLRADAAAVATGAEAEVSGADAVARIFAGRARVARAALIDGAAGAVWAVGGRPRVLFAFTIQGGRVSGIELLADPARLDAAELEYLP